MITRICLHCSRALRVFVVAFFIFISGFSVQAYAEGQTRYTVAIVPQFPPLTVKRLWLPLIDQVSRSSGVKLDLRFYRSIPDFERDFLKGKPDFVYLNPYHAIMARKAQEYIPLIRDSEQPLVGILVVRRDSRVVRIRDLNNKEIAFPSPNAFAASLYMRALLVQSEHITFTPRYLTTHSNVYRHVILDKVAAGGGVNTTLSKEPAELQELLKVIYRTPPAAPHPLCAHPRVPVAVREAVVEAILKLARSAQGRALLKAVELNRPVRADYHRDYAPLETLGLERFAVRGGD
jgi:phosphonate transport system substrate-binding protein